MPRFFTIQLTVFGMGSDGWRGAACRGARACLTRILKIQNTSQENSKKIQNSGPQQICRIYTQAVSSTAPGGETKADRAALHLGTGAWALRTRLIACALLRPGLHVLQPGPINFAGIGAPRVRIRRTFEIQYIPTTDRIKYTTNTHIIPSLAFRRTHSQVRAVTEY